MAELCYQPMTLIQETCNLVGDGKFLEHSIWVIQFTEFTSPSTQMNLGCFCVWETLQKQTLTWGFLCRGFIGKVLPAKTEKTWRNGTEKEKKSKIIIKLQFQKVSVSSQSHGQAPKYKLHWKLFQHEAWRQDFPSSAHQLWASPE